MGSPKTHPKGLKLKTSLIILTLIISLTLTFFPSHSDGSASTEKGVKQKKMMVLGSRPPGCFNKCLGCNPCKAALIISPHHKALSVHQRDEGYYLLSWKCKCGNKIFQP
ncbi:EPIDERMAL PATTERNING FACTOR-like protein 8 [Senna tora]|uniref:Epidermal patterning factor-like protein n=1 Tax=Senna tora TaxID=362788 RepID=A0A834W219_9FABA|nr:EPIDERMAL PATTERNING FACTOR-like protein 8 [Senna tora]